MHLKACTPPHTAITLTYTISVIVMTRTQRHEPQTSVCTPIASLYQSNHGRFGGYTSKDKDCDVAALNGTLVACHGDGIPEAWGKWQKEARKHSGMCCFACWENV